MAKSGTALKKGEKLASARTLFVVNEMPGRAQQ
jgi:hypothetical protein